MKKLILFFFVLSAQITNAASIEVGGAMRVDTTRINNYRKTSTNTTSFTDSHIIKGSNDTAVISTYIFRLNPELIVNDHVSVKTELSAGQARGGSNGDNTGNVQGNFVSQFFQTNPNGNSSVSFNQFYMEVYSDLATYKIGRYAKDWGLGVLYNKGSKVEDRFFTMFDGVEGNFSLGKIFITPYWAQLSGAGFTHDRQAREIGVSAVYDNPDSDQKLGILWSHRKAGPNSGLFTDGSGNSISSSLSLIDFFYQKYWDTFSLAIEVPYIDGDIKSTTHTGFKPAAYIAELGLEPNDSFKFSLKGGYVSGDTDNDSTLESMNLNPNYKISKLMFHYNLDAVEDTNAGNIYDASVTNTTFARLGTNYMSGAWNWKLGILWAQANEVIASQSKDLGIEGSLEFEYLWNPKLSVSGFLAYHLAGKYYETSTSGNLSIKNPIGGGLAVNLEL